MTPKIRTWASKHPWIKNGFQTLMYITIKATWWRFLFAEELFTLHLWDPTSNCFHILPYIVKTHRDDWLNHSCMTFHSYDNNSMPHYPETWHSSPESDYYVECLTNLRDWDLRLTIYQNLLLSHQGGFHKAKI